VDEVAMTDVGCHGLLEICRATYSPLSLKYWSRSIRFRPQHPSVLTWLLCACSLIEHPLHMRRRARGTVPEYLLCVN